MKTTYISHYHSLVTTFFHSILMGFIIYLMAMVLIIGVAIVGHDCLVGFSVSTS